MAVPTAGGTWLAMGEAVVNRFSAGLPGWAGICRPRAGSRRLAICCATASRIGHPSASASGRLR